MMRICLPAGKLTVVLLYFKHIVIHFIDLKYLRTFQESVYYIFVKITNVFMFFCSHSDRKRPQWRPQQSQTCAHLVRI